LRAPHLGQCLEEGILADAGVLQRAAGGPEVLGHQGQQEVLAGDVLVLELLGLLGRLFEEVGQPAADVDVGARAPHLRLRVEGALGGLANLRGVDPHLAQERARHAVLLVEQRQEQVLRRQFLVPAAPGQLMRGLDGLSGLDRQLVEPHGTRLQVSTAAKPTSRASPGGEPLPGLPGRNARFSSVSYLVLARKYRPQRFSELIGQEHVARTLSNAIAANRVHHAFLFTGARGVGKTSAARILAKALSCEKGPTAEPCGVCEICQEIAGGRSVDVIEIDAASNTKVEETKSVLEGVRYLPARARRKVYIIDEVHMLSAHSWNALLKTLEEPPPHVVFVFATTEAHKIPGTILSRCQRFDFKLIPTGRLAGHLDEILRTEKIDAAPEAIRLVARQAAGSVRDALSLLDQTIAYVGTERLTAEVAADVLGIADRQLLVALATAVLDRDPATALRLIARAVDRGVDLGQLGRAFLQFLRDLEVASSVKPVAGVELAELVDGTPEELDELRGLAGRMAGGLATVLFDRWARALDEATRLPAPRLLYEMAAIDLC